MPYKLKENKQDDAYPGVHSPILSVDEIHYWTDLLCCYLLNHLGNYSDRIPTFFTISLFKATAFFHRD